MLRDWKYRAGKLPSPPKLTVDAVQDENSDPFGEALAAQGIVARRSTSSMSTSSSKSSSNSQFWAHCLEKGNGLTPESLVDSRRSSFEPSSSPTGQPLKPDQGKRYYKQQQQLQYTSNTSSNLKTHAFLLNSEEDDNDCSNNFGYNNSYSTSRQQLLPEGDNPTSSTEQSSSTRNSSLSSLFTSRSSVLSYSPDNKSMSAPLTKEKLLQFYPYGKFEETSGSLMELPSSGTTSLTENDMIPPPPQEDPYKWAYDVWKKKNLMHRSKGQTFGRVALPVLDNDEAKHNSKDAQSSSTKRATTAGGGYLSSSSNSKGNYSYKREEQQQPTMKSSIGSRDSSLFSSKPDSGTNYHYKTATSNKQQEPQQQETLSPMLITPRESFVQLDFDDQIDSKKRQQQQQQQLQGGRLSLPSSSYNNTKKPERNSFANILQTWQTKSADKPNGHFLSPDQRSPASSRRRSTSSKNEAKSYASSSGEQEQQPLEENTRQVIISPKNQTDLETRTKETPDFLTSLSKQPQAIVSQKIASKLRERKEHKQEYLSSPPKSPRTQASKIKEKYIHMRHPSRPKSRGRAQDPPADTPTNNEIHRNETQKVDPDVRACFSHTKSPSRSRGDFKKAVQNVLNRVDVCEAAIVQHGRSSDSNDGDNEEICESRPKSAPRVGRDHSAPQSVKAAWRSDSRSLEPRPKSAPRPSRHAYIEQRVAAANAALKDEENRTVTPFEKEQSPQLGPRSSLPKSVLRDFSKYTPTSSSVPASRTSNGGKLESHLISEPHTFVLNFSSFNRWSVEAATGAAKCTTKPPEEERSRNATQLDSNRPLSAPRTGRTFTSLAPAAVAAQSMTSSPAQARPKSAPRPGRRSFATYLNQLEPTGTLGAREKDTALPVDNRSESAPRIVRSYQTEQASHTPGHSKFDAELHRAISTPRTEGELLIDLEPSTRRSGGQSPSKKESRSPSPYSPSPSPTRLMQKAREWIKSPTRSPRSRFERPRSSSPERIRSGQENEKQPWNPEPMVVDSSEYMAKLSSPQVILPPSLNAKETLHRTNEPAFVVRPQTRSTTSPQASPARSHNGRESEMKLQPETRFQTSPPASPARPCNGRESTMKGQETKSPARLSSPTRSRNGRDSLTEQRSSFAEPDSTPDAELSPDEDAPVRVKDLLQLNANRSITCSHPSIPSQVEINPDTDTVYSGAESPLTDPRTEFDIRTSGSSPRQTTTTGVSNDSPWTKRMVSKLDKLKVTDEENFTARGETFSDKPWQRDRMVNRVETMATSRTSRYGTCQCANTVFSEKDDTIDFFLPLMGTGCTCGRGPKGLRNPEEPTAIENILRPWQVQFLTGFGIYRGDHMVKAHHRSAKALAVALRLYRKKQNMTPFRTKSCAMALQIWSKTCRAFVRSIRKQLTTGTNELKLPNTLYILSSFLEKLPTEGDDEIPSSMASSVASATLPSQTPHTHQRHQPSLSKQAEEDGTRLLNMVGKRL